ncbi:MAG: alpha-ketoacid dehydrogenase subunit beta, partial [Brevundimonas sp.]|nr:alpha-ketoacid dehydrogenase subunit beta [Brevundimonas sp.]
MSEKTFTEADRTDGLEPDGDTVGSPAPKTDARLAIQPMNMIQALNSALDAKMAEDPNVLSFGEDAGYFGGVFRVTDKLQEKHGLTRSFD